MSSRSCSTFRRSRLAGPHLVAVLVGSLIVAVALPNSASASTSLDCAIEAGSPGSSTTTDVGGTQDPFGLTHPIFGGVTYFAHGNGDGKSTGLDIAFTNPVTSILVSIVANEDAPGAEYEEYEITGEDTGGNTVLNVVVRKVNGDFVFADDGATSVTPLNGPSYAVPFASSASIPSSLSVARPIASGESIASLEIRWTSDTAPNTNRSAILVVIDGQGQPSGACTSVAAVAAPQQPSAPVVQSAPAPSPPPSAPMLKCDPTNVPVGSQVTCRITGGDPDIDILWNASVGGMGFAGRGVTLDSSGTASFTFVASVAGEVQVDLVAWGVTDVVIAAGPVPASVPAGEGSVPSGAGLFLLLGAAGVLVAGRRLVTAG